MRTSIVISSLMTLCGLIGVSTVALAQDSTSTATSSPDTAVPETANQATEATPREERRGALSSAAQTRLLNLAANVSNRMDAYVRRITNVTDRLESRAGKLEAEGLDVASARGKIADARRELEQARTTLGTIDSVVGGFVGSENPRAYWQQVKTTYTTARDAIKAAHRATIETLLLLQSATAPAPAPTATSTETTTNDVE